MRFAGKRFLIVDDQAYSVKHTIRRLRAEGAEVEFDPSLADACQRFERLQSETAPRLFDLALIDVLCPPLPAQLKPYFDGAQLPDTNPGVALGLYLDAKFAGRQPYALFTIMPTSGIQSPAQSSNYKGIIEKIGHDAISDRILEIIGGE